MPLNDCWWTEIRVYTLQQVAAQQGKTVEDIDATIRTGHWAARRLEEDDELRLGLLLN